MDTGLLVGLVSAGTALCSVLIAYFSLRNVRSHDISRAAETRLADVIKMSSESIRADVQELKHDVKRIDERGPLALTEVSDRVGVLETKVEVFWKDVAIDAARILHSPHASRAELDRLLEAFEQQRLTRQQVPQLIRILNRILDVHVGTMVDGVGVTSGDQISAAIILRYIERDKPKDRL